MDIDISQLMAHAATASTQVFVCTAATPTRKNAHDFRPDVNIAVVVPGQQEVVAYTFDSPVTFLCDTPFVMGEVLIGLGFCECTLKVPGYLTDFASDQYFILEKPLIGEGICIRPFETE